MRRSRIEPGRTLSVLISIIRDRRRGSVLFAWIRNRRFYTIAAVGALSIAILALAAACGSGKAPTSASGSADVNALLSSALQDQVAGRADQATATYQKVL